MWYRQIESHLDTYMKRVDDVLGDQWAKHIDGEFWSTENRSSALHLTPLPNA